MKAKVVAKKPVSKVVKMEVKKVDDFCPLCRGTGKDMEVLNAVCELCKGTGKK